MRDILKMYGKGVDTTVCLYCILNEQTPFYNSPILVLNNFPENDKPLQLVVKTFQNMFPAINPETIRIVDCKRILLLQYEQVGIEWIVHEQNTRSIILRHYSILRSVTGVSKAVETIANKKKIPNLSNLKDISEQVDDDDDDCRFLMNSQEDDVYEMDDESLMSGASLTSTGTVTSSGVPKQAVKLVELGPRMRISLMLVESGLYQGEFLYNEQTKEEEKDTMKQRVNEKKIQEAEIEQSKKDEEKNKELEKQYKEQQREENRMRENRKKEKKERAAQAEKEKQEKNRKVKGKVFHKKGSQQFFYFYCLIQ